MTEQPGTPPPGADLSTGPQNTGEVDPRAKRSKWIGMVALPLSLLYFPVGIAVSVFAIVLGVRARRDAARKHGIAPGATAGIVMGSIALAMSILALGTYLLLRTEYNDYVKCRRAANTLTDEKACKDEFSRAVRDRLGAQGQASRALSVPNPVLMP